MERVKEIRDAIDQLLDDKPDLAIHLIADGIPQVHPNTTVDDSSSMLSGATEGLAYSYNRILHGLRSLKAEKFEAPSA